MERVRLQLGASLADFTVLEPRRCIGWESARDCVMDTSLISAFFAAQLGQVQLAAAAWLAHNNPQSGSSVAQLVDAAQQNFDPLANVATGVGANLDVTA